MDIVAFAKSYLASNAAESGADELIRDLIIEVERLRVANVNRQIGANNTSSVLPRCRRCGKTPENIGWCEQCGYNRDYFGQ